MLLRTRSHVYFIFWMFIIITTGVGFGFTASVLVGDYQTSKDVFKVGVSDSNINETVGPVYVRICNANFLQRSKIPRSSRLYDLVHLDIHSIINASKTRGSDQFLSVQDILQNSKMRNLTEILEGGVDMRVLEDVHQEFVALYSGVTSDTDWAGLAAKGRITPYHVMSRELTLTQQEIHDYGHNMEEGIVACRKNNRPCLNG